MKRCITFLFFVIFSSMAFAMPDIQFMLDGSLLSIHDDRIYYGEENSGYVKEGRLFLLSDDEIGNIIFSEDAFIVNLQLSETSKIVLTCRYDSPYPVRDAFVENGVVVETESYVPDSEDPLEICRYEDGIAVEKEIYEYEDVTGNETREIDYELDEAGNFVISAEYISDPVTEYLVRMNHFSEGKLDGYISYEYDDQFRFGTKYVTGEDGSFRIARFSKSLRSGSFRYSYILQEKFFDEIGNCDQTYTSLDVIKGESPDYLYSEFSDLLFLDGAFEEYRSLPQGEDIQLYKRMGIDEYKAAGYLVIKNGIAVMHIASLEDDSCRVNTYSYPSFNLMESELHEDGVHVSTEFFDSETGAIERKVVFSGEKTETYSYIKFTDGSYRIDDEFYINKNICSFDSMEEYVDKSKTDYIDWNDSYYVLVTEYAPTIKDAVYRYVRAIQDRLIRFDGSVHCVGFVESNGRYAFVYRVADGCLDRAICYRIEYIVKPNF